MKFLKIVAVVVALGALTVMFPATPVILVAGVMYFLPSLAAAGAHKRDTGAICVLNLFLGWTLLGWVGALVWAATNDRPLPAAS